MDTTHVAVVFLCAFTGCHCCMAGFWRYGRGVGPYHNGWGFAPHPNSLSPFYAHFNPFYDYDYGAAPGLGLGLVVHHHHHHYHGAPKGYKREREDPHESKESQKTGSRGGPFSRFFRNMFY